MARQVIVLQATFPTGGIRYVTAAFWNTPLTTRQPYYARPGFTSQVKDATAGETTNLVNGAAIETVETFQFPSTDTLATIQTQLATRYGELQTLLGQDDRFQRAGSSWDGTTWTLKNNVT